MTPRSSIAGFVITRDEESRITRSVQSLQAVCDHVVVIDSESTDQTCQTARGLGADTVVHPFEGFAAQRNWSINHVVATYGPDYLMTIDADEWLTPDLLREISVRRDSGQLDADAYLLRHPFQHDTARCEERDVNKHLIPTPHLTTERRADLAFDPGAPDSICDAVRRPYLRRRWVRQHIRDHLPIRPAHRFFQLYVLSGGALDGRAGFHRALIEAWREMCTDLKAEAQAAEKSHSPQP